MRVLSFFSGLAVLFSSLALMHIVHHFADRALESDRTPAFWIMIIVTLIIDVFSFIGGILLLRRAR
jgi:F0F1-type ATP synthase membrane subunit c/vacuolar-type H+-ATPase subunit K